MKVKLIRAILHEGKSHKVGEVLTVPDILGKELISMNKAISETVKVSVETEESKPKK